MFGVFSWQLHFETILPYGRPKFYQSIYRNCYTTAQQLVLLTSFRHAASRRLFVILEEKSHKFTNRVLQFLSPTYFMYIHRDFQLFNINPLKIVEQKFHQIHTEINQTHFATTRLSKPHLKNIQLISYATQLDLLGNANRKIISTFLQD